MSGYDPGGGGGGGWGQQPPAGGGGGGWGQQPPPGGGGYGGAGGGGGFGGGGDAPVTNIPFTPDDEKAIASMASFMVIAGALSIVGSLFGIASNLINALRMDAPMETIAGQICGAMIGLAIVGFLGAMLIMAGQAFKKVVQSSDQDQVHLTEGLRKLRAYFMTKGILIILALVCCCVGALLGGFAVAALGAR